MTNSELITLKENRLNKLKANGKNVDSNGVVTKLAREIRNLRKSK